MPGCWTASCGVMQSLLPQVLVVVGVVATERGWNSPRSAASGSAFLFWGHRGQCVIDGGRGVNSVCGGGTGCAFKAVDVGDVSTGLHVTDRPQIMGLLLVACLWRSDLSFLECKMALMVIAPSWGCLGLNELPFVSCLAFCPCWTGGSSFDYNPGTSGGIGIRSWCCPQSAKPLPSQPVHTRHATSKSVGLRTTCRWQSWELNPNLLMSFYST